MPLLWEKDKSSLYNLVRLIVGSMVLVLYAFIFILIKIAGRKEKETLY
jgi:hypothetical protein